MTITQKNEEGKITVILEGWLDHDSSPELGEVIDSIEEASALTLDFEKVEYISSAGIRMLVTTRRKAKELEAEFSLININEEVFNILAMTGLDKKLGIKR